MDATFTFFLVISAVAAVWGLLTIYGSITRSRWGGSLPSPSCPKCGAQLPLVRKPTSIKQLISGGWTCPECGCEVDKWGGQIPS